MTQKRTRNIRKPEGFENVQGYFMIANQDAAIAIVNKLTGTQMRLWVYLMVVDSFADTTADGEKIYHEIPSPAEIAIKIGVSTKTVEKDMRKLRKLGLYDYRITGWKGHNSSAAKAKQESQRLKQKKKPQTKTQQSLGLKTSGSPDSRTQRKESPQTQTPYSLGLNSSFGELNSSFGELNSSLEELNSSFGETESTEKPGVSESLQIYTDLLQTFSEEAERERFLKFCKRQAEKLPTEVVMIRSWIGKHAQELLEMYKESTGQIDIQEKEKCSAQDSDRELINAALESGEITDYDMGCKSVRYPGTKWWTDVEDFLATKRENQSSVISHQSSSQLPVTPEEVSEAEEITETPKAQGEFVLPDFKLKTLNRSAQRVIEEALRNGEIEAHDQVNGMVKKAGDRWWTYTNEFLAEKRGSS